MKYYIGAYAASPNQTGWDPQLETAYYDELKQLPNIKGLEHPFQGKLHGHDDNWFLANIAPQWDYVFTCIPGIMNALGCNPQFGLASCDTAGRQEALDFMQQACNAVAKLNSHLGRQAVKTVMLQTAPARDKATSSADALYQSLSSMQQWDWQGARLLIEHCDAFLPAHAPSKGFLSLSDEIAVLNRLNTVSDPAHKMGIVINWGRSVFETRRPDGALEHIMAVQAAGLLSGLMFSGVSDQDTEYGAWRDSHQPPQSSEQVQHGEPGSWMTEQAIHQCLAATEDLSRLSVLGAKIGIRPHQASVELRIAYIRDMLAILERYC